MSVSLPLPITITYLILGTIVLHTDITYSQILDRKNRMMGRNMRLTLFEEVSMPIVSSEKEWRLNNDESTVKLWLIYSLCP
jgi:hypothetical protein